MSTLMPRYPGSKARYLIQWDDGARFDAVVEPFLGAGHFLQYYLPRVQHAFAAEADPSVLAIWHSWLRPNEHHRVYWWINSLQRDFAFDTKQAWAWQFLKGVFHEPSSDPTILAAASLVIRKLAFGGIVRCSKNGKLNVTYSKLQLPELLKWEYRFPPQPPIPIHLDQDWSDAVTTFSDSEAVEAIALVDPPYYVPRRYGRVTPCYPNHKPHSPDTLDLFLDCTSSLLSTGRCSRIICTNYYSPETDDAIRAIASQYNCPITLEMGSTLTSINRGMEASSINIEATWILGHEYARQLELFAS